MENNENQNNSPKAEATPKVLPSIQEQLFKALRLIEEFNLLYFKTLNRINILVTNQFKASCGGIGYDPVRKKIFMLLNEDAIRGAVIKDVAGLLEHESGHLYFDHIFFSNPEKYDSMDLNRAQDYIINDSCHFVTSRMTEIKKPENKSLFQYACFFDDIKAEVPALKNRKSSEITSFELYEILKNDKGYQEKKKKHEEMKKAFEKAMKDFLDSQGKGQKPEQGENQGPGEPVDDHGMFKISQDKDGNDVISDEKLTSGESKEMTDEVKAAVVGAIQDLKKENQLHKAIGQQSGAMKILLEDFLKSKTDKNSVLNFVTSINLGAKRTWYKINNRFPMLSRGKKKLKKPVIVFVIDTSGSMACSEFFMMINYQAKLLLEQCEQLWIVVGDTKLQWSSKIDDKFSFTADTINFKGFGGTNLQFGWDFAKEVEADGVVCHTDGYIGDFDTHGINTEFYLYGNDHQEIPNFTNYRVYPE